MAIERRKHPRRALALQVRWQQVDLTGHHPAAAIDAAEMRGATSCDFSDGGLAFRVEAELAVDSALALEIERGFGGPPLSALGRVARCARVEGGYLVGVELTWVEATQLDVALQAQPESAWRLL